MNPASTGGTQAVARAAALLREIAAHTQGAHLADLALRLELERPTAYRILQRLVLEGLAHQDPMSKTYTLGPLLYELGLAAKVPPYFQGLARDALSEVARCSGDTVFGIVSSGRDSLCIDRQEGDYPVKALLMNPGKRRPLGAGSGSLALLSAMPADKAQEILRTNQARLQADGDGDIAELAGVIEQARHSGFVLRAPVSAPDIFSLATAVTNRYGTPVMAISISAQHFRISHRLEMLQALLRDARRTVQDALPDAWQNHAAQT